MKIERLVFAFALLSIMFSLSISWQQSAGAQSVKNTIELPVGASQSPDPLKISLKSNPDTNNLLPRISFEKTVCDLGDVGQGTKNTCEFRFTNTGRGLLKIGNISRTCEIHRNKKTA
jgi:hypothetical protein